MNKTLARFIVVLLGVALLTGLPAWAQSGTALTGTVKDASGAVIPGATVTLTHKGTGATRTTTSGANGVYLITNLDPADYRLEFSAQGFKMLIQDPVKILVGITSNINVSLEVGQITESVIVESSLTGLNLVDATIGDVIEGNQVLNLPIGSLDPAGLLSLQPGVTFVPAAASQPGGYSGITNDPRGGSVNGARSDQTNITLDGVDVNDSQNGFAFSSVLRATQASLQEFRVITTNANSDQGRSGAAQVQLVTKSGSNDLHGLFYYTHRNEKFNANDFFNNRDQIDKGKSRRHIYGAALGGPIVKDRFFLFGNFERLEEALESSRLQNVPSESFKDGVLIYQCADPALCPGNTATGVTGGQWTSDPGFYALSPAEFAALDPSGGANNVGAAGANPNVISYFQQFPVANSTSSRDNINIKGFRFNSPVGNDFKTYIMRADLNIDQSGNHSVFARGTMHDDAIVSSPPAYPGLPSNQVLLGNSRGLAIGYKAILGSSMVNQLRYGFTRIGEKFAGIRTTEFVSLRFIAELNGFDTGGRNTSTRRLPTQHIKNDFSWTKGNHTMSFGGEARRTRNSRASNGGSFNSFSVNPSWLPNVGRNTRPGSVNCFNTVGCNAVPAVASGFGSAWNDTAPNLMGIITQVNGNFNFLADGTVLASGDLIPRRFAVNEYEVYFQDSWRATSTLTFTFGLRYYNSTPPWETNGNQVSPQMVDRVTGEIIPGGLGDWFEIRKALGLNGGTAGEAPTINFVLGGPANNAPHFFDRDNNNWSPRLAAAWNPQFDNWFFGNGKMVIRGGYSLVYDRMGQGLAAQFNAGGSFGMSTSIASTFGGCDEGTGNAPNGTCARFTSLTDTTAAQAFLPAAPPASFPALPPDLFSIDTALNSNLVNPHAHTFDVTISREVGNMTFEVAYVGRRGRNLLISKDLAMPLNLVDPASGRDYFTASVDLIAAFEAGTDISQIAPDPFWENFFPGWGPTGVNGGAAACAFVPGSNFTDVYSATQVAYDWVNCVHPDTTVVPFVADLFGFPGYVNCTTGADLDGDGFGDCPEGWFSIQYATLAALSSDARSEYHAAQFSMRRRLVNGFQFTVNYVLSHSLDLSSNAERSGLFGSVLGSGGYLVNSWNPELDYATSDFDMRHQFNSNWFYELPVGRGRAFGSDMGGVLNNIIGGWEISGIFRANSGLPAQAGNGRVWATNWNVSGNATCTGGAVADFNHSVQLGPCAPTQSVKNGVNADGSGRGPNLFANPEAALDFFRSSNPGERGVRNELRADNYVNLDFALGKAFMMPWEGHSLKFRWEIFNLTNSVFFDAASLNLSRQSTRSFGDYTEVMGAARTMQISLRYQF